MLQGAVAVYEPRKEAENLLVGSSLEEVRELIRKVAETDTTVLIRGETGTGKELVAKAIHNLSPRCLKPFVAVDCAVIQADLEASELFGHERGAFTGAIVRKPGKFEFANRGTVFLDELCNAPRSLQAKFCRVLQEKRFTTVGGLKEVSVDIRVIAATNLDLEEMLRKGELLPDLFYRLDAFPITLPPLRERKEDIPELLRHFSRKYVMTKRIPAETMELLLEYDWPGNVRELEHLVEVLGILADGAGEIMVSRLPAKFLNRNHSPPLPEKSREAVIEELLRMTGGSLELRAMRGAAIRLILEEALRRAKGDVRQSAELLGVDLRTFARLRATYAVRKEAFRFKAKL